MRYRYLNMSCFGRAPHSVSLYNDKIFTLHLIYLTCHIWDPPKWSSKQMYKHPGSDVSFPQHMDMAGNQTCHFLVNKFTALPLHHHRYLLIALTQNVTSKQSKYPFKPSSKNSPLPSGNRDSSALLRFLLEACHLTLKCPNTALFVDLILTGQQMMHLCID